jgi:hypothetical protein
MLLRQCIMFAAMYMTKEVVEHVLLHAGLARMRDHVGRRQNASGFCSKKTNTTARSSSTSSDILYIACNNTLRRRERDAYRRTKSQHHTDNEQTYTQKTNAADATANGHQNHQRHKKTRIHAATFLTTWRPKVPARLIPRGTQNDAIYSEFKKR